MLHFTAPYLDETLVFQNVQQLGLKPWRHLTDFIKKQRAAVGQLHKTDLSLCAGPCKGMGRITK